MSTKIETIGTYLGTIAESAVGLTKGGKPQWVAKLAATKKYVESKEEIAHFQKQQGPDGQPLLADGNPGYVDWTSFDEDMIAYLMLYNSADEISPQTEMKNAEQLHVATGWMRPDFASIAGPPVLGAEILFRVQEKKAHTTPEGKTFGGDGTLEVSWIDHKDAAPERTLKSLDPTGIAGLMAKVSGYSTQSSSPKPVAAKPMTKPALTKPSTSPTTATVASSAASQPTATAPVASAPSAPAAAPAPAAPKARKTKAPTPPPPAAVPLAPPQAAVDGGPPADTTMEGAWEYVCLNKGEKEDSVLEDHWLKTIGEVGNDPGAFTGAQWAKVRDTVMSKLAA